MIEIHHSARISSLADIEDSIRGSRIVIEDDVWIGANCVLLDDAILRRGVVVGAGSIVRGELLAYGIYIGNPIEFKGFRA